jgi:hypothetical protein
MNNQGQISLPLKCRLCLVHELGNVRINDVGSTTVSKTGTAFVNPNNIGSYFGHSVSIPCVPPEQRQEQTKKL